MRTSSEHGFQICCAIRRWLSFMVEEEMGPAMQLNWLNG